MRSPRFVAACALVLAATIVTSCSLFGGSSGDTVASSSSSSSAELPATGNVSYRGVLSDLGVTATEQGTHKLTIDDTQFLVLESTDAELDLDSYNGRRVEVRGSVRPMVEAGGMIMRVEEVTVLDASSVGSMFSTLVPKQFCGGIAGIVCPSGQTCVDDPSDDCDPLRGGADCGGMCVPETASSLRSSMSSSLSSSAAASVTVPAARSSLSSSVASSLTAVTPSSVSSANTSTSSSAASLSPSSAEVELMAKQNYDDPLLWTQKYCTSHRGFCIPAHKNWYYKSFGATTSNRWHVEFGMSPIEELGQGAIALNLVAGSSASMNATNGQVKTQGSEVIGFLDWTDGTHFEIIADARLRSAVGYMLLNITSYAVTQ